MTVGAKTRRRKADVIGDPNQEPPKAIPFYENLPPELKDSRRWLGWRWDFVDGKWDKPPFSAKDGSPNGWQKDGALASIVDAAAAIRRYRFSGLGFVMPGTGLIGIDLDDCRDPDTGEVLDWTGEQRSAWKGPTLQPREIMEALGGYWEVSVSGTGFRAFIACPKVDMTLLGNKKGAEFYAEKKYLTISGARIDPLTGARVDGEGTVLTVPGDTLNPILASFQLVRPEKPAPQGAKARLPRKSSQAPAADDQPEVTATMVIDAAMSAANGDKFAKLWDGDFGSYGGDHSSADSALVCLIAFYAGPNEKLMESRSHFSGDATKMERCSTFWPCRIVMEKTLVRLCSSRTSRATTSSLSQTGVLAGRLMESTSSC